MPISNYKSILFLFVSILLSFEGFSFSKVLQAPKPAWVKDYPNHESKTNYEFSDGYGYILSENQVHVAQETKYYHFKRKIFSEIGVQNGSEITVLYDPEYQQLKFHRVVIHRNGKKINKLNLQDFKVIQRETDSEALVYDGKLSAILTLKDVRVGDIIEYSFSIVGHNPIYNGKYFTSFYLGFYDPCDQIIERIIAPADRTLNYQLHHTSLEPKIETKPNETIYEWYVEDVPNTIPDDLTPDWYDPYPFVWVSEYNTWKEISTWSLPFYHGDVKKNSELADKIQEIESKYTLPSERISAALKFVQNEVRYLGIENGIGAYKPTPPDQVVEQRFGDCKDKSLLLVTMLKELGVEAYPALVSTYAGEVLDTWLPSPSVFNHCIVQVKLYDKTYWYDPTINYQEGSFDNIYFPNYGKALVIKKDSGGLTNIDFRPNTKTEATEHFIVDNFDSAAVLEVETLYHGARADEQRRYFKQNNLGQISKNYLNYYTNLYPEISADSSIRYVDDTIANIFTTYEHYHINNFWVAPDTANPDRIQCEVYAQMLWDQVVSPSSVVRTSPISLNYPIDFTHHFKFTLPETWNIKESDETIEGNGIYFNCRTRGFNNVIKIDYQYRVTKPYLEASEAKDLVAKHKQIDEALGYALFYTKNFGEKYSPNWLFIMAGIILIVIFGFLSVKIYQYDPVPDFYKESIPIGGWLAFFAIGLFFSPLVDILTIINGDYLNNEVWSSIANSSSSYYNPSLAILLFFEFAIQLFFIISGFLLIKLFLNRRSSFPKIVTILMALHFILPLLLAIGVHQLNLLDAAQQLDSQKEVFRSFVYAAVWIPYFNMAQRVKNTFTETLADSVMEEV